MQHNTTSEHEICVYSHANPVIMHHVYVQGGVEKAAPLMVAPRAEFLGSGGGVVLGGRRDYVAYVGKGWNELPLAKRDVYRTRVHRLTVPMSVLAVFRGECFGEQGELDRHGCLSALLEARVTALLCLRFKRLRGVCLC